MNKTGDKYYRDEDGEGGMSQHGAFDALPAAVVLTVMVGLLVWLLSWLWK